MKFCKACGKSLPEDARFCPHCGQQVEMPQSAYQPVTVMYVDIVGYTRMVQSLSPEDVATLTTRFFDLLAEVVNQAGGIVYQKLGDGALCVFGYPRVMEDAAVQALQACIHLLRRLSEVDPDLQVHGGVASGKVLVIPGPEVRFVGEPMNLAARLEARSKPGEFLVDAATRHRAGHVFSFTHGVTAEIPGFGPREVFILRDTRKDAMTWRQSSGRVFVGRERDLLALEKAWTRFAHDPHPTMVRVQGEAGIGKTRLLVEFLNRFARNRIVVARALPFGMPPFGPLLHALRDALSTSPPLFRTRLFGQDPDAAGDLRAYAREILPEDPEEAVEVLVGILSSLFLEPRMLVLDDAQWADEQTFRVLEELFRREIPLFFLMSSRPPDPGKSLFQMALSRMEREIPSSVIRLSPFTHEESWIFWERLHGSLPDEEVFEEIFRRTGGNPLFMEETARLIATDGADPSVLPERLEDIIRARVSQFPPSCQELLMCASLLGPVFPESPVRQVLDLPHQEFSEALAYLIRHGMLIREAPTSAGENVFAFRHILLQEAVLASVTRDRLRQFGKSLLEYALSAPMDWSGLGLSRAQTFARLARFAGDFPMASRFLLQALQELERGGAWREMLHLLRTFQDMEVAPDIQRALTFFRARALMKTGKLDESRALLEGLDGVEARLMEGEVLLESGDARKALDHLKHLEVHDPRLARRRDLTLVRIAYDLGQHETVEALWKTMEGAPLPEDPEERAGFLLARADTLPYTRFKTRIRLYRDLLALSEEYGLVGFARKARNALMELAYRGMIAESLDLFHATLEDARSSGDRKNELQALYHRGVVYAMIGAYGYAREDLERYWEIGVRTGYRDIHVFGNWLRAYVAKGTDEVDEMFEAFREASTWAWKLGQNEIREYLMDDFAHALMEHGRTAGIALFRRFSNTWPLYRRLLFAWRWNLDPVDPREIFRHAPAHLSWAEWLDLMVKVMEKDPLLRPRLEWKARRICAFVLSRTPEHLRTYFLNHPWYGFLVREAA